MDNQTYMQEVTRTVKPTLTVPDRLVVGALGLTGEAGEVADIMKKLVTRDALGGVALSHEARMRLADEVGDVLWYIAFLCLTLGISLDMLMALNVQKLRQRFPHGWQEVEGH